MRVRIAAAEPDFREALAEYFSPHGIEALPTIRALAPHGAFDYLVKRVNVTCLSQSVERALMMQALVS